MSYCLPASRQVKHRSPDVLMRSANPDLIFDDVLQARARAVSRQYSEEGFRVFNHPLDRVTLFVSHRCNLMCVYCNGPHLNDTLSAAQKEAMLKADFPLESFKSLMPVWAQNGLKHIHFTGGECTLNKNLPEFVRISTDNGVLSSITTNGTAEFSFYKKMVDNGLSEIRISIDTMNETEFNRITRSEGYFPVISSNIAGLVRLKKEENRKLFIVLNACVGKFNLYKIKQTLSALKKFGVDDIKLLAVAEQNAACTSVYTRKTVDDLLSFSEADEDGRELLKKKIRSLFRNNTYGLKDILDERSKFKCFIPVSERTLDARGYYPCSTTLRYYTSPIADIDSSFEEQRLLLNRFTEAHDCLEDDACVSYCNECCKRYNLEVNHLVKEQLALKKAAAEDVFICPDISETEVAALLSEYKDISQISSGPIRPYVIIKSLGMRHEAEIKDYLSSQGIVITAEHAIPDWNRYSLFLYFKDSKGDKARYRIARNKAFVHFYGHAPGKILVTEDDVPEKKLFRLKTNLIKRFGEELHYCAIEGRPVLIRENCVHAPSYKDLEFENKLISYLINPRR